MKFSFFDVVLLIGVSQGFFIAGLIWLKGKRTPSKTLLSLLLTAFGFLCLKILLHTTGLWQTHAFRYFPLAVELAIQPLIWLYVLALTKSDFAFRKKQLLHFLPFALSLAYSVFIYGVALGTTDMALKDVLVDAYHFNTVKELEDYLSVISAVTYWALGLRVLLQYRKWVFQTTSNTDYPTYAWLRNIALLMGLLIAALATDVVLDYFFSWGTHVFIHWQIFFVYMAALIYYIGFRGYQLPETLLPKTNDGEVPTLLKTQVPIDSPSELRLELSSEKRQAVQTAIDQVLETQQLYLDASLSIQKLAAAVNASPAVVSAVINQAYGKNFRNLVNDYRLTHVKKKLKDPRNAHLSIAGIAYESGFNSEASFYRIFKAAEGISPKEYMHRSEQ